MNHINLLKGRLVKHEEHCAIKIILQSATEYHVINVRKQSPNFSYDHVRSFNLCILQNEEILYSR